MQSSFVLSVCGPDAPGMAVQLTKTLRQLGAEVESSQVMRLGGQISILFRMRCGRGSGEEYASKLAGRFPGLKVRCAACELQAAGEVRTKVVKLDVKRRGGAAGGAELQALLANLACEVENLDHAVVPVIGIGETVFTALCIVKVAEDCPAEQVADEIELMMEGARVRVVC